MFISNDWVMICLKTPNGIKSIWILDIKKLRSLVIQTLQTSTRKLTQIFPSQPIVSSEKTKNAISTTDNMKSKLTLALSCSNILAKLTD